MWIEIFRSGEHTDAGGQKKAFSEADLEGISSKYNNKVSSDSSLEAPLVKGHPKSDEPAYGWIEKLSNKGQRLLAKLKDVSPELISEIRKGMFKKVSMAIYPDNMLRHVGLLGAFPPAVKGLKNVEFNSNDTYYRFFENTDTNTGRLSDLIEYSENILLELSEAKLKIDSLQDKLQSHENKQKRKKFLEFASSIGFENHSIFSPKYSNEIAELLTDLSNIDSEYSDRLMGIINNVQQINLDNNLTSELDFQVDTSDSQFSENMDAQRLELHKKALDLIQKKPETSYEEAVLKSII